MSSKTHPPNTSNKLAWAIPQSFPKHTNSGAYGINVRETLISLLELWEYPIVKERNFVNYRYQVNQ